MWGSMKHLSNTDQNTNRITNLPAPVNDSDAATKKYVDDNAGGGSIGAPDTLPFTNSAGDAIEHRRIRGNDFATTTSGDTLFIWGNASQASSRDQPHRQLLTSLSPSEERTGS